MEQDDCTFLLDVLVGVGGVLLGWGAGRVLLEQIGTGLMSPPAWRRRRKLDLLLEK